MTNPMDAGLMGQRVQLGQNGSTVTNTQQHYGQAPMMPQMPSGYRNPNSDGNYPTNQPPVPTPGPAGTNGAGGNPSGDQSPFDSFQEKWFNKGKDKAADPAATPDGKQQPDPTPTNQQNGLDLGNLTPEAFQQLAGGMDFTKGIPDDILAMFQPDEHGQTPNMLQGMMAMMNHVSRGVYSSALAGSGRLAHHGISDYGSRFQQELPKHLQKYNAQGVVKGMNIPQALAPSVENMVQTLLSNNPDATPETISEMLEDFMNTIGKPQGAGQQAQGSNNLGDLFGL